MAAVFLLGLTGGIGSGKSTVAKMLATQGAAVIDSDAISRGVTASGGAAIEPLSRAFGTALITPDGALDRQQMRSLVFSDPQARQKLESIVHPLISAETEHQTREAVAQGARCIVFDIPLLVESGSRWRARLDRVLVVDCSVETQIERVMARSGLSREEIERIVGAQASRGLRLSAADVVLHNEGLSLAQLQQEALMLARHFGL